MNVDTSFREFEVKAIQTREGGEGPTTPYIVTLDEKGTEYLADASWAWRIGEKVRIYSEDFNFEGLSNLRLK